MSLDTFSLSALASLMNSAISEFQLPIATVSKFKDKPTAIKRVQHAMDLHGLYLDGDKFAKRPTEEFTEADVEEIMQGVQPHDARETAPQVQKSDPVEAASQPAPEPDAEVVPEPDAEVVPEPDAAPARSSRKGRVPRINHAPQTRVLACRDNTNQSVLRDQFLIGRTIATATSALNNARKEWGKEPVEEGQVYATLVYDLIKMKGYGCHAEQLNGEQLYVLGDIKGAEALGFKVPVGGTSEDVEFAKEAEGYDSEQVLTVYFLDLPEDVEAPAHTARKGK